MEEGTEPEEVPTKEAVPSESADPTEATGEADAESAETLPADTDEGTVAGIPVKHNVLFAGGLILAVGALVGIHFYQKRSGNSNNSDDDDDV